MIADLAKTAASMYTGGALGALGGSGGGRSSGTSSQKGALINYFDKTQGGAGSAGASSGGGAVGSGGRSGGGGPASTGGTTAAGTRSSGSDSSLEFSQIPAARATIRSSPEVSELIGEAEKAVSLGFAVSDPDEQQPLATRRAWPKLDLSQVLPHIDQLIGVPWKFK